VKRRLLLGLALAALVLGGATAIVWIGGFLPRDSARAASIEDALRRFRASSHSPGKLDGVYIYATRGSESIDALGSARHHYPATTSITAITVPCGVRLRWDALDKRSTTWTFCTTAAGIELRRSDEAHSFFGQTDRTSYACRGRVLLPPVGAPAERSFVCRSKRGAEIGQATVLGHATVEVDGKKTAAVHVRTALRVTGGDAGSETIDWWLEPRLALPLRLVLVSRTSRPLFVGRVHYRENLALRLLSLTPRR
jgi:hypothetical protein